MPTINWDNVGKCIEHVGKTDTSLGRTPRLESAIFFSDLIRFWWLSSSRHPGSTTIHFLRILGVNGEEKTPSKSGQPCHFHGVFSVSWGLICQQVWWSENRWSSSMEGTLADVAVVTPCVFSVSTSDDHFYKPMAERRQPNPIWIFHSVANPIVSCPPLTQVYYLGNSSTSNHGFIKTVYHIAQLSWWTVYLKRLKKQQSCTWKDWHRPPGKCRLQGGTSILPYTSWFHFDF